jgi:hypothetical protein
MAPSTCCFCTHPNPARAKFCNECASPLHLKPCRLCDAVNARDAQACYRCEAGLPEAPATVEPSPERIVAEADETLAELKRELIASPGPAADVSREPVRSVASEGPADVSAAFDVRAREPLTSAGQGMADDRAPVALGTTDEQSAPAIDALQQAVPLLPPVLEEEIAREHRLQQAPPADDERVAMDDVREAPAATDPLPTLDTPSVAVHLEDRQWRPERRSRRAALVIVAALVVLPAAVYVMRNPAQLDEWLGRLSVPSIPEPAPQESSPAVPAVAAPAPVPAPATAGDSATAALPADAAPVTSPAQARAAGVTTLLPPSPPVDSATPFLDEPTSITVTPERDAKATSTSRARSSAARARPRERLTKPRPQAPAVQSQRNDRPADADQAPRTEPCPEAVAALGLCKR